MMQSQQSSSESVDRQHWHAINRNATQIASHEAMCEERSRTIFNRLDRIDDSLDLMSKRMFTLGVMIIGGMAGLLVTLLSQGGAI
jgi:hypothetical protein